MNPDNPNASTDILRVPDDPEAMLFVPTEMDAERVGRLLDEQITADEFGTGDDDVSLWSELKAQLNKQQG
jgi:hypothetical protein